MAFSSLYQISLLPPCWEAMSSAGEEGEEYPLAIRWAREQRAQFSTSKH